MTTEDVIKRFAGIRQFDKGTEAELAARFKVLDFLESACLKNEENLNNVLHELKTASGFNMLFHAFTLCRKIAGDEQIILLAEDGSDDAKQKAWDRYILPHTLDFLCSGPNLFFTDKPIEPASEVQ